MIGALLLSALGVTAGAAEARARAFCAQVFTMIRSEPAKVTRDDYTSDRWTTPIWWVEFSRVKCAVDARDGTIRSFESGYAPLAPGYRPRKETRDAALRRYLKIAGVTRPPARFTFETNQGGPAGSVVALFQEPGPKVSESVMVVEAQSGRLLHLTRRAALRGAGLISTSRPVAIRSKGEAILRARRFAEAVQESVPYQPKGMLLPVNARRGDEVGSYWTTPVWRVSLGNSSFAVDVADGMIRQFHLYHPHATYWGRDRRQTVKVSMDRLVQRYAAMAGSPLGTRAFHYESGLTQGRESRVVSFNHRWENVHFARFPGNNVDLDMATGLPNEMTMRKPPAIPYMPYGVVLKDAALAPAVAYAFSDRSERLPRGLFDLRPPASLLVKEGPEFLAWVPNPADSEDGGAMMGDLSKPSRPGETVLTYWARLEDGDSPSRQYFATMLASSGKLLAFSQGRPVSSGGSSGESRAVPPSSLRSTSLAVFCAGWQQDVKGGWRATTADPVAGQTVGVRFAERIWRGVYDVKSNRLALGSGEVVVEPDDGLAKVLREMVARPPLS